MSEKVDRETILQVMTLQKEDKKIIHCRMMRCGQRLVTCFHLILRIPDKMILSEKEKATGKTISGKDSEEVIKSFDLSLM